MSRPFAALIAAVFALTIAGAAQAHAFLQHASPRVGDHLAASPIEVRLWFSEALEALFSSIAIIGPGGAAQPEGAVRVDGTDHRQLVLPITRRLAPGTYRVRWRALSVDGHATQGDFSFQVGA
jgi:methionine-rich copper-binding protein CopC